MRPADLHTHAIYRYVNSGVMAPAPHGGIADKEDGSKTIWNFFSWSVASSTSQANSYSSICKKVSCFELSSGLLAQGEASLWINNCSANRVLHI